MQKNRINIFLEPEIQRVARAQSLHYIGMTTMETGSASAYIRQAVIEKLAMETKISWIHNIKLAQRKK